MIIDGEHACKVTGYLQPPETENLEPGLPRLGVCSSDHISLMAELSWPTDGQCKSKHYVS
jgi:hypothetical protein